MSTALLQTTSRTEWPTLAQAPLEIIDGDRGSHYPKKSDFYQDGFCLFLSARNVTKSGFRFDGGEFINQERDLLLRKGRLVRQDLVLTTRGTLGNVAYFNERIPFDNLRINSGMVIFRCDRSRLIPSYVYAFLRSSFFDEQVQQLRSGAAQPQLPIRDIKKIRMPIPPLTKQHRIADILSAYDDHIENNNRQIDLLEESIHLLYREWFVYLRFPGHERVKAVDGEPEGWTRAAGKHAIAFNPRTPIPKDKVRPYVPMGSISTDSMRITDLEERVPKGGAKFRNGDTLLARITPCLENGKTGFVQFMPTPDEAASGSTEFIVMRGKTVPSSWIYCLARSAEFRQEAINRMSGSDGRQRVDWKALAEVELLIPSEGVAAEFDEAADGVFRQILLLNHYSEKLREARDLLLPRLMDGRIPV